MCRLYSILLPVILGFVYVAEVGCIVCTKEELFDTTTPLVCPGPLDPQDKVYCCGPKRRRFCCSYAEYAQAINTIGIIVGVLVTAIVVVVLVVVVSCFCCSCCLLARHRHNTAASSQPAVSATTTTGPYASGPAYPIQTFPTSAYPQQQFQQQYPQQQFQQHYPMQQPPYPQYPQYGNPPPYPINDQPPYNPSFGK